jgi:hypothetical protein
VVADRTAGLNPGPGLPVALSAAAAVFFDPTGRRRRAVHAAMLVVLCVAVILGTLVVIGFADGAHAPRIIVGPVAHPGRATERASDRQGLSQLPSLPSVP